jgi:hypothetical protein
MTAEPRLNDSAILDCYFGGAVLGEAEQINDASKLSVTIYCLDDSVVFIPIFVPPKIISHQELY